MKRLLLLINLLFIFFFISAQKNEKDRNDMTYLFIEALKNKTFGNINQSGYLLTKYTTVDSTCAACYFELSKLYFSSGNIESAIECANKSYNLDKLNYWYVKNYADLLRINKQYLRAYELYNSNTIKSEKNVIDKFILADLCLNLRKDKEGLQILDDIESVKGISEKVSIAKYKFYLIDKNYKKAYNTLNKLITIFPDSSYLYGIMAEFYAIQNKKNESNIYFTKYIAKEPYNANALYAYGKYLLTIKDTVSSSKIFDKLFYSDSILIENKITILKKLILDSRVDAKNKLFIDNQIKKFISIYDSIPTVVELACDYYEKSNQIDKALFYCKKLVIGFPKTIVYWERLLFYFNINQNYDSVVFYGNVVTSKFPDRPFLFLITGIANFQKENFSSAKNYFKRGFALSVDNNELQYQFINFLADSYYKLQMNDSAYYYFELAIENEKADIVIFNNYAYYLAENSDRLIRALELSRLTLIKSPKNPTFLDTYAWICYKMKNYNEAYKYIKLAYSYSKVQNSEILDHYGDILFCIGKEAKARNIWLKAKKISKKPELIEKKMNNFKCL